MLVAVSLSWRWAEGSPFLVMLAAVSLFSVVASMHACAAMPGAAARMGAGRLGISCDVWRCMTVLQCASHYHRI
jgi:hypothetical protein